MKCREKNSEKTFLKIENTEVFWEKLKETKVRVIQISESGIIVSDGLCKYYAGFGEFLIISNDSRIEVCCEEEFNRCYEVIDVKADISGDAVKELNDYIKQFADELKKIKDVVPKININNEAADVSDMIKNLKEGLSEILKV